MTRCTRRSRTARAKRVVQELELLLAADEAGRSWSSSARRRRRRRRDATPPRLPGTRFASRTPSGSVITEPRVIRATFGPSRISPGSAACCSRAAALIARPVAKVVSSSSDTISPDSIPIRTSSPSLSTAVPHRKRGPHGPLGVVLVRHGNAERGHDGVAGEPLHDAAVRGDAVRDLLEEPLEAGARDLRIARSRRAPSSRRGRRRAPWRASVPSPKDSVATHPEDGAEAAAAAVGCPARLRWGRARPRRSSRRTTCAASTDASSTRRAPTRSAAPTWSSSSRVAIAVGRDMRSRAPAMAAAVMDGAADGGADVRDLGMVGTEMVYYAVGDLGLDGGICVTASHNPKEYTGMKIVRARRAAGRRRLGPRRRRRRAPRPASARSRDARRDRTARRLARVRRQGALVRRRRRDQAAPRRRRRGQRDGGRDASARPRAAAAGRRRPLLLRPRRHVPEPRAEPAAARRTGSSSSRRRATRAPTSASRTTATPTAASSSTTPASSSPATSSPRCSPQVMLEKNPGGTVLYDLRASWAVPRDDRGCRRHRDREPRRPRVHQAPHARGAMRSSPARSRRTTTSATSRRPTRASSRSCSCSSCSRSGARSCPRSSAPSASSTSSPARSTRRSRTCRRSCEELEERYGSEGGRISHIDGVSVDFDTWHFNVRPSNTEPLLRLNLEALSEDEMAARRDEVVALIQS